MGQVIGPIDPASWLTLKMLKASIEYDKEHNENGDRTLSIKKEKSIYKEILDPFVPINSQKAS